MLGIRRAKGHHAAFYGTFSAILLAILVWGMPVQLAVMATLNGMLFGLFPVVWIIITAIWVYNMTVESGEFEIIKSSDTSSNALFGALQKTTAQQIGVDPALMVAANSSGGVTGKMISPQSLAVATAATGLVGEESAISRFTLKHSIAMVLVLSVITLLQAYVLKWMLP